MSDNIDDRLNSLDTKLQEISLILGRGNYGAVSEALNAVKTELGQLSNQIIGIRNDFTRHMATKSFERLCDKFSGILQKNLREAEGELALAMLRKMTLDLGGGIGIDKPAPIDKGRRRKHSIIYL